MTVELDAWGRPWYGCFTPGDQEKIKARLAEGYVRCPECGGSGESEHWTTCGLCSRIDGVYCVVRPEVAKAFNDGKLYAIVGELQGIGLNVVGIDTDGTETEF